MHSHVADADLPLQLITECFDCFIIAFIFEVLFSTDCMHACCPSRFSCPSGLHWFDKEWQPDSNSRELTLATLS